ncbi:MAG: hypothetical protein ACE5GB_07535, partial [Acidimicrobiales bacterium]
MLAAWARLIARSPRLVASLIVVVCLGVGAGMTRTETTPDLVSALVPRGTELAEAVERLDERFPGSGSTTTAQIIVRGDVLDPEVLTRLDTTVAEILDDPVVAPFVADSPEPVIHSSLI